MSSYKILRQDVTQIFIRKTINKRSNVTNSIIVMQLLRMHRILSTISKLYIIFISFTICVERKSHLISKKILLKIFLPGGLHVLTSLHWMQSLCEKKAFFIIFKIFFDYMGKVFRTKSEYIIVIIKLYFLFICIIFYFSAHKHNSLRNAKKKKHGKHKQM